METKQVAVNDLIPADYNPRKWSDIQVEHLKASIRDFGFVEPVVANSADERKNIVIGGHFRLHVAKLLGYTEVPVVYVNIPSINKERELNLRLNRNQGDFDYKLLSEFDEDLLKAVGFSSVEIDRTYDLKTKDDEFDAQAEADKITEPTSRGGGYIYAW